MLVANIVSGVFMFWYAPFLLVLAVYNNACNYNVAIVLATRLLMIPGFVYMFHLILIALERYIAIVYPLHYETKFTDRTLKWSISTCWATGILWPTSWLPWLTNPSLRNCELRHAYFPLIDSVVVYIPVCVTMFICYGKILGISWRQRQRIQPMIANPASVASGQTIGLNSLPPTQSSKADNTEDPKENPLTTPGTRASPATTSGTASGELAEQQRQKCRRGEFKAVYLTGAIIGAFVILWFPNVFGRLLDTLGYNSTVVDYLYLVGGALGSSNFALSWAIYAAVSKRYRLAYRQMLTRIGCCKNNVTLPADCSFTV